MSQATKVSEPSNKETEKIYYYDESRQGVESEEFATYIRHAFYATNSKYKNRFKDYYKTGELYSEGVFISIDEYDDNNSEFEEYKLYYKNGSVMSAGKLNGDKMERTSYYKNGQVKEQYTMINKKAEGKYLIYNEDGFMCKELFLEGGKIPSSTTSYQITAGDYTSKVNIDTGAPVNTRKPELTDLGTAILNGMTYSVYKLNGLILFCLRRSY